MLEQEEQKVEETTQEQEGEIVEFKKAPRSTKTLIEWVAIVVIAIELLWGLYIVGDMVIENNGRKIDAEIYQEAIMAARTSSKEGKKCPYTGPTALQDCSSNSSECFIGYYDITTGNIIPTKPQGYNRYSQMEIKGKFYSGAKGTMVLEVSVCQGELSIFWTKGA